MKPQQSSAKSKRKHPTPGPTVNTNRRRVHLSSDIEDGELHGPDTEEVTSGISKASHSGLPLTTRAITTKSSTPLEAEALSPSQKHGTQSCEQATTANMDSKHGGNAQANLPLNRLKISSSNEVKPYAANNSKNGVVKRKKTLPRGKEKLSLSKPTEQKRKLKLIEKIRGAQFLYDSAHVDHTNAHKRQTWFKQVDKEIGLGGAEKCQKIWKNLQTTYRNIKMRLRSGSDNKSPDGCEQADWPYWSALRWIDAFRVQRDGVQVPSDRRSRQEEFKVRLIEKVREARFIYDKGHKDHMNWRMRKAWFEQSAKELGFDGGEDVKRTWTNMRSLYVTNKLTITASDASHEDNGPPTWPYFSLFTWLDPFLEYKRPSSPSTLIIADTAPNREDATSVQATVLAATPSRVAFKVHLIEKVRAARFIYDTDHVDYRKKPMKQAWWKQVAKDLGLDGATKAKEAWKVLRVTYGQVKKKLTTAPDDASLDANVPPTWRYWPLLTWLEPFREQRESSSPASTLVERKNAPNQDAAILQVAAATSTPSRVDLDRPRRQTAIRARVRMRCDSYSSASQTGDDGSDSDFSEQVSDLEEELLNDDTALQCEQESNVSPQDGCLVAKHDLPSTAISRCAVCRFKPKSEEEANKHRMLTKHDEMTYVLCDYPGCGEYYNRDCADNHLCKHYGEKHVCGLRNEDGTLCGFATLSVNTMANHRQRPHDGEYHCTECNCFIETKSGYTRHKTEHEKSADAQHISTCDGPGIAIPINGISGHCPDCGLKLVCLSHFLWHWKERHTDIGTSKSLCTDSVHLRCELCGYCMPMCYANRHNEFNCPHAVLPHMQQDVSYFGICEREFKLGLCECKARPQEPRDFNAQLVQLSTITDPERVTGIIDVLKSKDLVKEFLNDNAYADSRGCTYAIVLIDPSKNYTLSEFLQRILYIGSSRRIDNRDQLA